MVLEASGCLRVVCREYAEGKGMILQANKETEAFFVTEMLVKF